MRRRQLCLFRFLRKGCIRCRMYRPSPALPSSNARRPQNLTRWCRRSHTSFRAEPAGLTKKPPCSTSIVECQLGCIPTGSIPTTRSTYHVPHDRDDETRASTHIGPYLEGGEQEAITRHPHVALVGWKNPRRTAARGHGACRNNARSRSKSEGCSPGKPSADRTDGGCWGLQAPHCLCGRGQSDGRPGRRRG